MGSGFQVFSFHVVYPQLCWAFVLVDCMPLQLPNVLVCDRKIRGHFQHSKELMRANTWLRYTQDCCGGLRTKQWAASVLVPPTQVCTYFLICSDINNSDLESGTCWNLGLNINVQCDYLRICVFVIPQLPKDPMRALPDGSLLQKKSFADLVDSLESTHSETLERLVEMSRKASQSFLVGFYTQQRGSKEGRTVWS